MADPDHLEILRQGVDGWNSWRASKPLVIPDLSGENYIDADWPMKRSRRTQAEMDTIRQAVLDIVNGGDGMTVRHLFYRLVSAGVIEKTEAEYDGTVKRLGVELRRSGEIPFGKIIDGSRSYQAPRTYGSVREAVVALASSYRRSYWDDADRVVEVWCEKDAIRALIEETPWDLAVPLMVTRGFASESIVQELAVDAKKDAKKGRARVILSLNDYDPSGSLMLDDIILRAQHYAPEASFHWEQVALTREQVTEYDLPTRPTKTTGNNHARNFSDPESVELDALDPDVLRQILSDAIMAHVDADRLEAMQDKEDKERQHLRKLVAIQKATLRRS